MPAVPAGAELVCIVEKQNTLMHKNRQPLCLILTTILYPKQTGEKMTELEQAIALIRKLQEPLSDEERLELWSNIQEDYCKECGRSLNGGMCYCTNDE